MLRSRRKREAAARKIAQLGKLAEPDLREVLKQNPAPEAKRRLERILAEWDQRPLDGELLAALRAIEALEAIGSKEAEDVLREFVKSNPFELLEREAKASLARLGMRAARKPVPSVRP